VILPSVLSVSEVTVWKANERKRLQRIENGEWRKVSGSPEGKLGLASFLAGSDNRIVRGI